MSTQQQTAQATPGRWTYEPDEFDLAKLGLSGRITAQAETPAGHPVGEGLERTFTAVIATDVTAEHARLICAAVNAVREVGYTVDQMEGGDVRLHLNQAALRNVYPPEVARDRAALSDLVVTNAEKDVKAVSVARLISEMSHRATYDGDAEVRIALREAVRAYDLTLRRAPLHRRAKLDAQSTPVPRSEPAPEPA